MNNIQLQGRLIAMPDVRYSQAGVCVVKYCLAVKREFFKQGEADTDFINCVAFGKTGEFAEKYLTKGQLILITGSLRIGSYMKNDIKFYTSDVIVNKHYFCSSKSDNSNNSNNSNYNNNTSYATNDNNNAFSEITLSDLDDLPF